MARLWVALLCATIATVAGCGGGSGGGGGPGGGGGDLSLVRFSLDGLDDVPVNRSLLFQFTCAVDPESVTNASVQIRAGEAFGRSVRGTFVVDGAEVSFRPELSTMCRFAEADYAGLLPATKYRVTVVGYPEEFCLRAASTGHPLVETCAFEFHTRGDTDPDLFEDQLPGESPRVVTSSPASGSIAVEVEDGNEIRVRISENLDPCSVHTGSVRFHVYETGDPDTMIDVGDGRASGFAPPFDATKDPYSWGSKAPYTPWKPAQRIPSTIALSQDYEYTEVIVTPIGGRFPENSLVVLDLTYGIEDFAGALLSPTTIAFTTENQPRHERVCALEFEGETPIQESQTTADVDTARSAGRAQGWLTFAGDGDNGADPLVPGRPAPCFEQVNDGTADDFDPNGSVTFDTGESRSSCSNTVDGSRAVVWEFDSFRLQSGLRIRFIGENPAIILVRGDVVIEPGAIILVRGSQRYGTPPVADGDNYDWQRITPIAKADGGKGVAGGGDGGPSFWGEPTTANDGTAGAGSPDAGVAGGKGAGLGGVSVTKPALSPQCGGSAGGGGGGGHAGAGDDGLTETSPWADHNESPRSDGGQRYWAGSDSSRMLQASAGSGGGGGGWMLHVAAYQWHHMMTGGAGGAGGGFLAIICGGDLTVAGTIDASGGDAGDGNGLGRWVGGGPVDFCWTGGGGGGSGGGILLLTPNRLRMTSSTSITVAGGARGVLGGNIPPPPYNHGGNGSNGRIVLEDGDSVVEGMAAADLVPGDGERGFYRGVFDPLRFQGERYCRAVTKPFYVGSFAPTFQAPSAGDFVTAVPEGGGPGQGATAVLVEVRGHPLLRDGTPNTDEATPWYVAGFFEDTDLPQKPLWWSGREPSDVTRASDCAGPDLTKLNVPGWLPYLQVRLTFYLSEHIGPFDPGPYLDRWQIRFEEDL